MSVKQDGDALVKLADGIDGFAFKFRVQAKTADYSVVESDMGSLFTTRGASGAVVFTLPAVTAALKGKFVVFFNAVNQDMTVNSTANEMITFNDVDADGIAFSTTSEKAGAAVLAVCDGTSWLMCLMTEETQTVSVTT